MTCSGLVWFGSRSRGEADSGLVSVFADADATTTARSTRVDLAGYSLAKDRELARATTANELIIHPPRSPWTFTFAICLFCIRSCGHCILLFACKLKKPDAIRQVFCG